jgi:hypothetical protein
VNELLSNRGAIVRRSVKPVIIQCPEVRRRVTLLGERGEGLEGREEGASGVGTWGSGGEAAFIEVEG